MQEPELKTAYRQEQLRFYNPKDIKKFTFADNIIEKWHIVNVNDTTAIECVIFTPVKSSPSSTFFYVPGTASATFCLRAERVICSNFAAQHNWRVILVVHRLSQLN